MARQLKSTATVLAIWAYPPYLINTSYFYSFEKIAKFGQVMETVY